MSKSPARVCVTQASAGRRIQELMPGDVALGVAGDHLKTLLGSCVCVILTDPRRTVGAMCHIVHVGRPRKGDAHNTAYGVAAMQEMFSLMHGVGIVPKLCQAYVYGGGTMFPDLVQGSHVGSSNGLWATRYLAEHGISVVEKSLGGAVYRKIAWTVGPDDPTEEMIMVQPGDQHGR